MIMADESRLLEEWKGRAIRAERACDALPLDCTFEDAADFKDNAARFDRAMELARIAISARELIRSEKKSQPL
jgi:hypothetical protein